MLRTLPIMIAAVATAAQGEDPPALWRGLESGPVAESINGARGTAPRRMNQLDYQMLNEVRWDSPERRQTVESEAADQMVNSRHVGIVPLTKDQALAAVRSQAHAIPDAPPRPGKYPVVLLAGGPYYLNTTAEYAARRSRAARVSDP